MKKRTLAIVVGLMLVFSGLALVPAGAGEAGPDGGAAADNHCKGLKGKKKKKCQKKHKQNEEPAPPAEPTPPTEPVPPTEPGCSAYEPGEMGVDAETVAVLDEHTAEAPLEVTVTQEAAAANDQGLGEFLGAGSLYDGTAHSSRNVQIDTAAAEAGLYIRYEFPVYEDHDLYVYYANGTEAAHVGGFNQAPVPMLLDGTGAGGHSEQGAEQLDGLRTADCAGYTLDLANFIGEGGDYTVKLWLGEIQNDPAPPDGGR